MESKALVKSTNNIVASRFVCFLHVHLQEFDGCDLYVSFIYSYSDPTVLRKFARVFVAFLRETPLLKLHGKFPEICAQRCLKDKTCKSFNFNKLEESCELFSVNAEDRTLESRNYRFDEYYQLIGKYYWSMDFKLI